MDWLEVARQLPLGHKRRIAHDCSTDRDMLVSHSEGGYSAYCFRCGPVGFEGHGYQTLEELNRINELNTQAQEPQSNELPADFTTEIPQEHILWLARGGISAHRAKCVGIGWSDSMHRIVIPVYDGSGTLVYWQARAIRKWQTPKYTNPPVTKATLLYWTHPNTSGSKARVVVTEDILSAIRIGKHVTSASILGTKTSDSQAAQLSEYDQVDYWLDPDQAGHVGAIAGTRKLGLVTNTSILGKDCEVDPKNLSDRAIRDILGLPANHRYTV